MRLLQRVGATPGELAEQRALAARGEPCPLGLLTQAVELGVVGAVVRAFGYESEVDRVRAADDLGRAVDWSTWVGAVAACCGDTAAIDLAHRVYRVLGRSLTAPAAEQLAAWRAEPFKPTSG